MRGAWSARWSRPASGPSRGWWSRFWRRGMRPWSRCERCIRTRPLGWPAEAPIVHAAGILGMLRPPSALPDLIDLARFYKDETGQVAGDAIAAYGPEGLTLSWN